DAAVLPAGAGIIGTAARTGFPRHGKSSMWCKARAAHRTPVPAATGVGARLRKYRVFLFSMPSKTIWSLEGAARSHKTPSAAEVERAASVASYIFRPFYVPHF